MARTSWGLRWVTGAVAAVFLIGCGGVLGDSSWSVGFDVSPSRVEATAGDIVHVTATLSPGTDEIDQIGVTTMPNTWRWAHGGMPSASVDLTIFTDPATPKGTYELWVECTTGTPNQQVLYSDSFKVVIK